MTKFAVLVLRNSRRNVVRTVLTVLSVAVALFIFVVLRTVLTSWQTELDSPTGARQLVVQHAVSLTNMLPETAVDDIRKLAGVEAACGGNWFGGRLDREKFTHFFAQFCVDHDTFYAAHPEIQPQSDEQRQAWLDDPAGALVGLELAEKMKWKVGTELTLYGTIYACDPELTIRGIYTATEGESADMNTLYFHRQYVEELIGKPGLVNHVDVLLTKDADAAEVITAIDSLFENSSAPTRSATLKQFLLQFVEMMGNIRGLVGAIAAAVLVSVLLATANSMAMTIRERTREIAVLKAIGFTPELVIVLITVECLLTSLVGGATGLGLAWLLFGFWRLSPAPQMFPIFVPTADTMLMGLAIAAGLGLVSAIGPAWRVGHLQPAEGLRRVD